MTRMDWADVERFIMGTNIEAEKSNPANTRRFDAGKTLASDIPLFHKPPQLGSGDSLNRPV